MATYFPECRINISAVFDGFGGPDEPIQIANIVPYSANVHLNSYKEADTWEVVFDAKIFPFSPELLRTAGVEIFLYDRKSLVTPTDWHKEENLIVTGLVDQATLSEDEQGGKVTFVGRDYTALMLDRQWDPAKSGRGGRIPDDELEFAVQKLVDEATNSQLTGRTLTVKLFDVDDDVRVGQLSQATILKKKSVIPRTSKSHTSRKRRGQPVKADSTYWDVIYKLCLSYGFIVYVKGFDVIIAKPHVLQSLAETQYRVAYGRNLSSLEVERKMSKEATPQIIVRSYDCKTKMVLEGRFPTEKDVEAQKQGKDKKGKGGGFLTGAYTKREESKIFTVPDIKDVKTLTEIARTTYYTLARGEGKIRFSTIRLTDLDNQDMLQIRAGDSVGILWDAFNAEVMSDPKIPRNRKIQTLLSLGYSIEVATLVADQYQKLDYFRTSFYVKEVNYTWEAKSGVKVDVEAMNFINPQSSRFRI